MKPSAPLWMKLAAGALGAVLAMTFFWLLTVPRGYEANLGAPVKPAQLEPLGELPALEAVTLDGTEVQSEALAGRVTVLYFWGTTCPPCVAGIPAFREAWRKELASLPDFTFVAFASDQDRVKLERFISSRGIEWPVAAADNEINMDVWRTLGIEATPTTIIVDPQGQIRWAGSKLPANLAQIVRTLAAEG